MTINDCICLCRNARYEDPATRENMRNIVLPRLITEADELEACRKSCEPSIAWTNTWVAAGFITEEVAIRQAIAAAEKRMEGEG